VDEEAVSEVIGTLILVGVVVVGIALIGILLLANPTPSKVPVFDSIISNRSKTIYFYHKGGDPLWAGQYKILVDGGDQTANFTISGGTDPWSVGETLTATSPTIPQHVVMILNQSGGGATVLAFEDFIGSGTVPPPSDIMWYNYPSTSKCFWQYRKSITIDGSKVPATLSNFPVLVNLPSDTGLSASAQASGNDILFTDSTGTTKLPHEIESYTSSTGALIAWVEVPTVNSGTNTVIYMYYGNSTVASQQNPTGVWDANYMAVWHFDHDFVDSTTNPNDGTNSGSTNSPAKIARAQNFDSINDYVSVGNDASIANVFASGGTFSAWIYANSIGENSDGRIGDKASSNNCGGGCSGWEFQLNTNTVLRFRQGFSGATGGNWATPASSITLGACQYVAVTYDSSNIANVPSLSINGVSQALTVTSSPAGAPATDAAKAMRIGNYAGGTGRTFDGIIDEVRASKSIRTPGWIATEYANQNSPSTFSSVGSEEQWWKC
jgi:flagellin-like protein